MLGLCPSLSLSYTSGFDSSRLISHLFLPWNPFRFFVENRGILDRRGYLSQCKKVYSNMWKTVKSRTGCLGKRAEIPFVFIWRNSIPHAKMIFIASSAAHHCTGVIRLAPFQSALFIWGTFKNYVTQIMAILRNLPTICNQT